MIRNKLEIIISENYWKKRWNIIFLSFIRKNRKSNNFSNAWRAWLESISKGKARRLKARRKIKGTKSRSTYTLKVKLLSRAKLQACYPGRTTRFSGSSRRGLSIKRKMHSGDRRNSISPSRFEAPEDTCKNRHACRHPAIIGRAGKESFPDHRGGIRRAGSETQESD